MWKRRELNYLLPVSHRQSIRKTYLQWTARAKLFKRKQNQWQAWSQYVCNLLALPWAQFIHLDINIFKPVWPDLLKIQFWVTGQRIQNHFICFFVQVVPLELPALFIFSLHLSPIQCVLSHSCHSSHSWGVSEVFAAKSETFLSWEVSPSGSLLPA